MNATIQEIEGIDDYWGPAFRSVYEGEGHEAFVQQLDERIIQHDKEIEKLCNFHYQKKRKRGRRPNKLRGVNEDQQEALQSRMSQYEDNNNHIPKRRRIDPKRLGGYINTFPEPDTQCKPFDPCNSSKVSDHDLSDENLEETSEMGISSDEYEEITEYHALQQLKQENHQVMSKEPDSSTDDLRLYLRNRNRLSTSVDHQTLITVEDTGNRLEQQSDYSSKDSADHQISMRDQQPVVKEVDVNSSDDLRSYLRSKCSEEQLGQDKSSYAEHYQGQSQHEAIQYDERHNHQVEYDRELRCSLFSKYNVGPRQYDDIRYEKGQSLRASVEHNKDQIRSLSTEHFRTKNGHETIEYHRDQIRTLSSERTLRLSRLVAKQYEKCQSRRASAEHDKVQRSLSSERNRSLSRYENFEYNRGQRRHVSWEQDRNQYQKADRQRVNNRPMSAEDDRGQNLREYNERYVRPSRPSSSEHYTNRNLHENIESQSPYSFKEHIGPRTPHGISDRGGQNGQRVFAHQLRGQSHHSAEYDSGDSYGRRESTERPKIRSRPTSSKHNIRQSRPSSSENYKQTFHPIIEYHKDQNEEQAKGSRRISNDYDRKSLSSHESADFDRGQGQALAERRRIGKSRPLSSERYKREIQGATIEYQRREKSHALCDKKSQSRPTFSEHYVQSGQYTEYAPGRKRSDSSEGHGIRSPPVSADISQNRLSYSEFGSQIRHKVFEGQKSWKGHKNNECFSGERGFLLSDHISDVQTDLPSADTAGQNRSYVSAHLQQEKSHGFPNRYQVDDRPLTSDIGRQVSSESCIKHHPLLPETQRETYRKSPDREDLSRPLSTQRQPTSVEMGKRTVDGQDNSAPGKFIKPNYEGCPSMSSSVPCHSISNRITSSQFFQNEILELELSHVERNDIENQKSFDCLQKKPNTTELKSCCDGVIDALETVLILHTDNDISMDKSTPSSNTPLSTTNPEEQNATNQLEASALLPSRGSSEPRDHGCESFAEMTSIQDISGNNHDSVETVIVDLDLKTGDVGQCITPEPNVKTAFSYTPCDAICFNASNESLKVTERHLGQDNKAPELKRLPESNVKSEPIYHNTNREISSAVNNNIAQNKLQQETRDYFHKFPSQNCETATPSSFIKSEIKQESNNDTLNFNDTSTLEINLGVNSSCGSNNEDKQGQATVESTPASSNESSFKVSVRDVSSINLLLSGANMDPFNAVLNKNDECEDDNIKMNESAVSADRWYTPRKIILENYPDEQKKLSIFALVNNCDPRLRPRVKRIIDILNEQKAEVLGDIDVAKSEISIKSDNTVLATKHYFQTSIDCQNKNIKPEENKKSFVVPNLAGKCGKLVLDILKSSKDNCCSSNKAQISPESPQIQDEQLFTSLKPMDIETQVADAIPIYDSANKNHNINDWIDIVNKVADFCNWSDQQVVGYAIPKIMGHGFDSNISWIEWQENLRTAFPSKVNYGKMLVNMLNTTAKVGDSLVEYYYEKKNLLDKCNITGEKAIECIIFGIEDESVRTILESLDFDDPERLLIFLSSFKN